MAGALLCAGLLFKVNLALVLAGAPVVFLLLRMPAGSARSQLARAAAGFGAAAAVAAAFLAVQGELRGYLEGLVDNVAYSGDVLGATGRTSGILGHIKSVAAEPPWQDAKWHFAIVAGAFLLASVLAIRTLRRDRADSRGSRQGPATRTLAALFLAATVTTSVTLALTAAWPHHLQMLAYPGSLLIAFLVTLIPASSAGLPKVVPACATVVVVVALMGGAASNPERDGSISTWLETGESETADMLESAAQDRSPQFDEITFAHLGMHDEQAVAAFLDNESELACPVIAQYLFTPELSGMLQCIRDERPRLVLVTPTFRPIGVSPPESKDVLVSEAARERWNRYVAEGYNLLSEEYELALEERTDVTSHGTNEVWILRG